MGVRGAVKRVSYLFLLVFAVLGVTKDTVSAREEKIVKVGYYLSDSFQEIDDEGIYSGFGYDYYMQIDKYTRWKYEFVQGSYLELMNKLIAGEIDIMAGMQKTPEREELLDFSKYAVGNTHSEIYARSDSDLYYEDYEGFNGCTIAVMKGSITKELIAYANEHEFTLNIKEYDSNQTMEDALENKEVDLIYASNLRNMVLAKIVGKFDKKELHYAVTKGKKEILDELNDALWQISNINPDFSYQMSEKYMSTGTNTTADFTREELEYLKEKPTINILLTKDWFPIAGQNKETGKWQGIVVDLLDLMAKEIGFQFKYYTQEDFNKQAEKNPKLLENVVAVLADDNSWAEKNNVYMSNHIVESCVVMIAKERNVDLEKGVVALPKNYYVSWLMKKQLGTNKIKYYDTGEECIRAVNRGKADMTYVNELVGKYYLSSIEFSNLYTSAEVGENENISFAIFKDSNINLLSIFDKALTAISEKELNKIVVNNSISDERLTAIGFFYAYPAATMLGVVILLIIIFIAIATVVLTRMKRNQLTLMLEKEENLNRARSDFYTMMSHEIRTPLNAVMGYIRLAKENVSERIKLERYLRKSEYSATQLVAIVNDLLEINDIEENGLQLREEEFTLHESISLVTETIQLVAQNQNVDFTVLIQNQLYNYLIFDKKRLNQVLFNLLENAVQNAKENSEVRLTIFEEKVTSDALKIAFTVKYKGIALPEDAIESLNRSESINKNSALNLDGMTAFTVLVSQFYTRILGGDFEISQDEEGISYYISFIARIGHPKFTTDIEKYSGVRALIATSNEDDALYLKETLKKYKIKSEVVKEEAKIIKKLLLRKDTEYAYKICFVDDVFIEENSRVVKEILEIEYAKDAPLICILAQQGKPMQVNILMDGVSKVLCKPIEGNCLDEKIKEILADISVEEKKEAQIIHFPGIRVLLVEDNPVNADILKTTLNRIEIEVDIAQNGKIGVDKFEASKPGTYQMILMDIQMPIMNGYEAAKTIRHSNHADAKRIPIIAVSANAFADDINNAKDAGMNEHVAKPVDYEKLNRILEKYIEDE